MAAATSRIKVLRMISGGDTERRRPSRTVVSLVGLVAVSVVGCTNAPGPEKSDLATAFPARIGLELTATGFFVDGEGDLLTANHAANGCSQLYVAKEGRTIRAELVAQSADDDLALLKVPETLGLPAVLADADQPAANEMVFASGYEALQDVLARGGGLFNAAVASAQHEDPGGDIELVSDATYGASGAPVLNADGLVIGIITHREATDHVLATSVNRVKAFLAAQRIAFEQDDRPQLSALQDRAHRAETISANVICFKQG